MDGTDDQNLTSDTDVDLGHVIDNRIRYLRTYARRLRDSGELRTLKVLIKGVGWRVFNSFIETNDNLNSDREMSKGDRFTDGRIRLFFTSIIWPSSQRGRTYINPLPGTFKRDEPIGTKLITTAWKNEITRTPRTTMNEWEGPDLERLSPQIASVVEKETPTRSTTTKLRFHYIKHKYYPFLKAPVDLFALDRSVALQQEQLNTMAANRGRGEKIETVAKQLEMKFPEIKITVHDAIKRYLIRMNYTSRIVTDFLDEMHAEIGIDWEWVNSNEILLLPKDGLESFINNEEN